MIEIGLFGQVRARVDGTEVVGLSAKQREILAILALADGASVSKGRLADRATAVRGLELRLLLRLLRQALDCTPGVRTPALDAGLSAVAARTVALAG